MVGSFLPPKIFILLAPSLLAKPVVEALSSSIWLEAGDVWLSLILGTLGGNGCRNSSALQARCCSRRSCACGLTAEVRARLWNQTLLTHGCGWMWNPEWFWQWQSQASHSRSRVEKKKERSACFGKASSFSHWSCVVGVVTRPKLGSQSPFTREDPKLASPALWRKGRRRREP